MNTKLKKVLLSVLALMMMLVNTSLDVHAATYLTSSKKHNDWWLAEPSTGRRDSKEAELQVNGERAFCIDAFTKFKSGVEMNVVDWSTVGIKQSVAEELALIAYFGTKVEGRTSDDWYAITQGLIWKVRHEADGHTDMCYVETPTNPNYSTTVKLWNEILADVEAYKKKPSFSDGTFEMNANDTLTLTDTNASLNHMVVKDDGGLDVSINGNNQLVIKASANSSDNATITLQRNIKTSEVGTSLVFYNGKDQSLAQFKINKPLEVKLNVKVNKFGSLELTKYNDDKSAVIPETTFRITGPHGFDKTLQTDENGKIKLEQLALGSYKAVEVNTSYGYIINVNEFDFEIKPNETTLLEVTNDEPKGKITVIKVNTNNDRVNGATFNVYANEDITNKAGTKTFYKKNELVTTVTTENNGEVSTKELPLGQYKVVETQVPENYILNTKEYFVTLKYKDQNTSIVSESTTIPNEEQKGKISLKKSLDTSKVNGLIGDAFIEGNKYELYAKEKIMNAAKTVTFYEKDQLISSQVTDKNGKVEWDNLPIGQYYIKESQSNDSLFLNNKVIDVAIEYAGQNVEKSLTEVETTNRINMQKIRVFKSGEKDGISGFVKGLQGAEFTFKLKSEVEHVGWDNATAYAIITTDKDGYATTPYLPYGKYLVKETVTPKDYITAPDFVISVTDDYSEYEDIEQIKIVNINNRPFTSQVKLVKKDKDTNQTVTLNSASFKIKDEKGNYVTHKVFGQKIDTFTTNSKNQMTAIFGHHGEVTLPLQLDAGTYTIEEIKVPDGFLELEEPITFTITNQYDYDVDEDDEPILEVVVKNAQPKGKIILKKTDKETNAPLESVEYELSAKENIISAIDGSILYKKGEIVTTGVTDKNGQFVIDDLFLGHYELKETLTHEGYVLSSKIHDIQLTQENTTQKLYTVHIDMTNIAPIGEIRLVKTDKDTSDLLSGVQYRLTAAEDIYSLDGRHTLLYQKGEAVSKDMSEDGYYLTNELGEINISELPLGKYHLQETLPLEGYVTDQTVYEIDLSYDGSEKTIYTHQLDVTNSKTTVEISKKDISASNELEGAKLTLFDKDNNVVETWTSTHEPHIMKGLKINEEYRLHEDLAPLGYVKANDITFTVQDTEDMQKVEMIDDIIKVEVSKQDSVSGKELAGAKLQILDKDGNIIHEWISEDKPHLFEKIPAGEYTLKEIIAPDGYEIAEDISFVVNETSEIQKVVMKDEPTKMIVKTGDDKTVGIYLLGFALATSGIIYFKKRKQKGHFDNE
jgi:LPXTG-motif cell wall-anchored protein